MTIITQTPTFCTTRKLTGDETLSELQQVKSEWLSEAQAAGHLEACRLLARTLGAPFTPRGWETSKHWRWASGAVTIEYHETPGNFLPWAGRYNQARALAVFVAGRQVCYYRESDDNQGKPADNFFVGGRWLDVVYRFTDQAAALHAARAGAVSDKHRRALLAQLCAGVEI